MRKKHRRKKTKKKKHPSDYKLKGGLFAKSRRLKNKFLRNKLIKWLSWCLFVCGQCFLWSSIGIIIVYVVRLIQAIMK